MYADKPRRQDHGALLFCCCGNYGSFIKGMRHTYVLQEKHRLQIATRDKHVQSDHVLCYNTTIQHTSVIIQVRFFDNVEFFAVSFAFASDKPMLSNNFVSSIITLSHVPIPTSLVYVVVY